MNSNVRIVDSMNDRVHGAEAVDPGTRCKLSFSKWMIFFVPRDLTNFVQIISNPKGANIILNEILNSKGVNKNPKEYLLSTIIVNYFEK